MISKNGINLLKQWEGCRLSPYRDSAGLLTIGYGHLLNKHELASNKITVNDTEIDYRAGITEAQAEALFLQDLAPFINAVDQIKSTLSQNQKDCLYAFCFNIGVSAFLKSSVFTYANEGRLDEVPDRLRLWNKAGGKVIQGLINRRNKEISLWNKK